MMLYPVINSYNDVISSPLYFLIHFKAVSMSFTSASPIMRRRPQPPTTPTYYPQHTRPSSTTSQFLHFRNPAFTSTKAEVSDFTASGLGVVNNGFLGDTSAHTHTKNYSFEPSTLPLFEDTSTPTSSATGSFFATLSTLPTTPRAQSPRLPLSSFSSAESDTDSDVLPRVLTAASSSSHDIFIDAISVVAEVHMRYFTLHSYLDCYYYGHIAH